jgi:hypothetical protein
MSVQLAGIEPDATGNPPGMKSRQAHTDKILGDDISWLESRIDQLAAAGSASERRLAVCYQKLLRQRRRQLASLDGTCPGCWQDYFC